MDSLTGTIFEIFQILSVILATGTLVLSAKRGILNKMLILDIPMMILMAHGLIYYFVVFGTRYGIFTHPGGLPFTYWSTALRFHGYATLFMITFIAYLRERVIWKQHKSKKS